MFDDLMIILVNRKIYLIEHQVKSNLTVYIYLMTLSCFVITNFVFFYFFNSFIQTFPLIHYKADALWSKVVRNVSMSNLIKNRKQKSPGCSTYQFFFNIIIIIIIFRITVSHFKKPNTQLVS